MNDRDCVMNTIRVIGSKWTVLILRELCDRSRRFGELQRALLGISPKTLSVRLKELERDGIVRRHVYAEVPLHVEYSLTKKGVSLREIINKMRDWGSRRN